MLELVEWLSHKNLLRMGATQRQVATPTGRMHAYDLPGEGRGTFVLVHGVGARATTFTPLIGSLRKHAARIILPDLPGHGVSTGPEHGLTVTDLTEATRDGLDKLLDDSEPAIFLGNSLGGAVSLRYALTRPHKVRALVLASPGGAPLSDQELSELRIRFGLKTREDVRRFIAALLHRPAWYMRLLEPGLLKQIGSPRVQGFLQSVQHSDFFSQGELGALVQPTTVVWGQSDRVLPASSLAFYKNALPPGTRFVEPAKVGHSPHLEAPALLIDQLVAARSG